MLLSALRKFGNGSVAQSVEQGIENPRVGGSIPSRATFFACRQRWFVRLFIGSSRHLPVMGSQAGVPHVLRAFWGMWFGDVFSSRIVGR